MFFNFKNAEKETAIRIDLIKEATKILGDVHNLPSIRIIYKDNDVSNIFYANEDLLKKDFENLLKNT